MVAGVLSIIAGIFAILMIKQIQDRQTEKYQRVLGEGRAAY